MNIDSKLPEGGKLFSIEEDTNFQRYTTIVTQLAQKKALPLFVLTDQLSVLMSDMVSPEPTSIHTGQD